MLVGRFKLIIVTFVTMLSLCFALDNPLVAGMITFVVIMGGYVAIAVIRQQRRINLLEKHCDPQAFIEATERQRKITGKNKKVSTYFDVDHAVGLMMLGENKAAKEILMSVDKDILFKRMGTKFVYTLDMISCLYALGDREAAETMFENELLLLTPVVKNQRMAMSMMVAYRQQVKGNIHEAIVVYEKLLEGKLTTRQRVGVLFQLAEIEEQLGNFALAREKYSEVAESGNKLWIALQARQRLNQ